MIIETEKVTEVATADTTIQNPKSKIQNPKSGRPLGHQNWREPTAVTAFFTVLTVIMTWPWTIQMGEAINPFGDVVLQMSVLRWNAHALVTNPFGLFEAPFFYPYAHSLAFSEHDLGQTITAFPFLLLTGNPALAYNLNVLLSFVLTGVFTYLLVRDLTGNRAAGLLAGVAYAFCPFRFMQLGHLHMLATEWFPFTLWALYRFWILVAQRAPRFWKNGSSPTIGHLSIFQAPKSKIQNPKLLWAVFGIVAMGLSSVYYLLYLVVALLLYALWLAGVALRTGAWRAWRRVAWRSLLLRVGLAALVIGAILLPVYLPYIQTSADLGLARTTYELENWSAQWSYFGKVLGSNWLYGNILAPQMTGVLGERELFFGIAPSILALIGLIWGKGRHRFYFALLGALSLLLTFGLSFYIPGTNTQLPLPYAFFYDWLPGFKALRVPVRFSALLDFSIFVLAGYGLAALMRRKTKDEGRKTKDEERKSVEPSIPRSAVLRLSSFVLRLSSFVLRPQSFVAVAAILLVLLEFANPLDTSNRRDVTAQLATAEPYGWLSRPENAGPIIELPMNPDQADVAYMLFATRHWQPIVNGWSGFVPPGTVRLSQAMAAFPDPLTLSLLQGLEVRHVVVHLWQFPKEGQAILKQRLDSTPQLALVDQAGDNYVYRLAPDPWLREIARRLGSDKTIWIGEVRHGALPSLEVLAYALQRMGVRREQIAGNIDIGYKPLGALPFGKFPDYALVPNDPNLPDEETTPIGLDFSSEVLRNAAVRLLWSKIAGNIKSYDMTSPDISSVDLSKLDLAQQDGPGTPPTRVTDYYFLAFAPSQATIDISGSPKQVQLPVGVSRYSTGPLLTNRAVLPSQITGDARLLRLEIGPGRHGDNQFYTMTNYLPLEITPSKSPSTLDARLRAIAPSGNGDFTITLDVYVEPWGAHPDGHFGSWSVVLPGDDTAHDYTFRLDPLTKTLITLRDGQPYQTYSWTGPPTQGDFRATLTVLDKSSTIANIPLYTFTLNGGKLTDWQLEQARLSITPVR